MESPTTVEDRPWYITGVLEATADTDSLHVVLRYFGSLYDIGSDLMVCAPENSIDEGVVTVVIPS